MTSGILIDWLTGLGDTYGVNPLVLGAIYVGATPLFALSLAWLVRNVRRGMSILFPLFATAACGASSYLYVMVAGENLPFWVYGLIGVALAYGIYLVTQRIRKATTDKAVADSSLETANNSPGL